jgi:potassium-dependent mechanosensitive channel
VKQLACLIGLFALFTLSPMCAAALAKEAPAKQQDRAQGGLPAQKLTPSQKKESSAQTQSPVTSQPPSGGQASPSAGSPSPANPAPPPEASPAGPIIDQLSASLKQIETTLERHDLTDTELQSLRDQVGPISSKLGTVIDHLAPRLAAIQARLDELGPSPKPGAETPPESPEVTAERAKQQKLYTDTEELLKRARLLAVEADQTTANITARRRTLFTRSLFARATSIVNPALWVAVWNEAPSDAAAAKAVFREWIDGINERLDGQQKPVFWGGLALILLLYLLVRWLARRVLARNPSVTEPTRFLKILGAWWVALVITVPALAMVFVIGLLFQTFDETTAQSQPFIQACGGAVLRIAAATGIARGLFAPTRPSWRLPRLSDPAAAGIVRAGIGLACVVSVTRLFTAINDIIGGSLLVTVATSGTAAMVGPIILGFELWRFGALANAEDGLGPEAGRRRDWFDVLRVASWIVAIAITVALLTGYAAFGSFLVDQFFWESAVACILFMSIVLVDEAIGAGFRPTTRLGRRLMMATGFNRNSLELAGVVVSGVARLALFLLAFALVVAPWGLQSAEVLSAFSAAFFGFKIDGVTISLSSIFLAIGIFALTFAAFHGVVQWVDSKLLPKMNFDLGLRNSIRTSLGYVGFVIAAGLALSYFGLNFEKLAIVAGALSVGIGFGLQSIVNNFVSGLILLWERAVRVGDWIVVGGDQGFVRRINVRSTEIETFDRSQVIIPNSNLITGIVTNLVRNDRTGRLTIPLTVSGSADPDKAREVLASVAKSHELVLKIPSPQVLFTGMSANALNFELRVFLRDVETIYRVRSDLHFEIFRHFKEAGFFDAPDPGATKVEIAGFENFGRLLKPGSEGHVPNQQKRDGWGEEAQPLVGPSTAARAG